MAVRIPDGTRIEKIDSKPGDAHTDGAQGKVLYRFPLPPEEYTGYFVEWDDLPGIAVFIGASRIRPVTA